MVMVYHNLNDYFSTQDDPDVCSNLVKVASVNTKNLNEAFSLTNHIEQDHAWMSNPGVAATPGRHRSTSVGDVLELEGVRYRVEIMGFSQV